ncbi:hypothetical protein VTK56DRAFT_5394 [Thermocarpiscus australiensis]
MDPAMPPLVLNPQNRAPLLRTQTHHPQPPPTLPIKTTKTHPTKQQPAPSTEEEEEEGGEEGSIYFIGTATTVLTYHGVRILTDPNFLHAGDHVHLGPGVTSRRLTDPAVPDLSALPPIDCILLSHYHEDHFDREVEAALGRDVPIVTTPHARGCLTGGDKEGGPFRRVYALERFERMVMPVVVDVNADDGRGGKEGGRRQQPAVSVTAMPGKHVPPGPVAVANELLAAVPPTNGWLVELGYTVGDSTNTSSSSGSGSAGFETGYRIYISGDTLFVDELKEIPARLKGDKIDLMLIHLGGTTLPGPKLPLLMVTMDAKQGVQLMRLVDPDVTVPIHFDDYDVFLSPLDDFKKEVEAAGLGGKVVYLDRGDEYRFRVRKV